MNKVMLLGCAFISCAMVLAGAANGQSIDAALAAYTEGRFIEAADIAEAAHTSEGYALAAKSLAVHAYYIAGEEERDSMFSRASLLAEEAIRSDPDNPEAHLQSAHVLGRHGQTIDMFEAANRNYPERIRELVGNALRLDPDMAEAYLSLGMWHAEVVGSVGSFMAGIMYDASERDALAYFEQAMERAPDENVVPYEYALGLLTLDEREYRNKALALLKRAIETPAKDAYGRIIHERAVERQGILGPGD